jgi:hypothetical protein
MKKNINTETIIGRVYQHDLKIKTVQNQKSDNFGKEFITGTLDVAVDEDGLNVISTHYTFVTETTKSGSKNQTYAALKKIIEEGKVWIADGKDQAMMVKLDTALALNDFYDKEGNLVAAKRNEGGFVTFVNTLPEESERNKFTFDMVVTSVKTVEADPERNIEEPYDIIKGAIFNFRNDLLPVELVIRNSNGMDYFEGLEASSKDPVYTKLWGRINSLTIKKEYKEESAFGEASVRTVERKSKEWLVTGTAKIPYDFGDESVMTVEELTKAMQDREVHLAEVKKNAEEYAATRAATLTPTPAAAAVAQGTFNF